MPASRASSAPSSCGNVPTPRSGRWPTCCPTSAAAPSSRLLRLRARTEDSPSYEERAQLWAKWAAWTPEQQAVESIAVDEQFVAALEALDDAAVEALHRELAGLDLDASQVLRLRVSEHSMHGWDIAVMFDDDAVVPPVGVPGLLDVLPVTLRLAAQPHDDLLRVRVRTTDPARDYLLELAQSETRLTRR